MIQSNALISEGDRIGLCSVVVLVLVTYELCVLIVGVA